MCAESVLSLYSGGILAFHCFCIPRVPLLPRPTPSSTAHFCMPAQKAKTEVNWTELSWTAFSWSCTAYKQRSSPVVWFIAKVCRLSYDIRNTLLEYFTFYAPQNPQLPPAAPRTLSADIFDWIQNENERGFDRPSVGIINNAINL